MLRQAAAVNFRLKCEGNVTWAIPQHAIKADRIEGGELNAIFRSYVLVSVGMYAFL
jgi:hypothetical protein